MHTAIRPAFHYDESFTMVSDILSFLETRLDAYLADLHALVSLDSYSTDREDVNRVVDWLDARLSAMGFSVQRTPEQQTGDNLLGVLRGSGKGKIMLLGHSDTVFPRGTTAQRPLTFVDDKILGPGTCDMKAGLLVGIYAIEALQAVGFDGFERIDYLCVSDEEIHDRPSIPVIRQTARGSNAVLTLEAARANGDIVTERKGVVWLKIKASGKSAHAGVEPEKGRNAIVALARLIDKLNAVTGMARGVSVNVGVIEGGRLPSIVPDSAHMLVDVRAFSPADLGAVVAEIRRLCETPTVPDVTFTVAEEGDSFPPMPRTPETIALEQLAIQAARELGFEVKGASTGGAADAAYGADEGVPALDGLGPIGGLDHGPDEYILKSSIVPRAALLARLMMLIAQQHAT